MTLSIRPEQMQIVAARGENGSVSSRTDAPVRGRNRLVGKVRTTTFLGEASDHALDVNGQSIAVVNTPPLFDVPAELAVEFDPDDVVILAP